VTYKVQKRLMISTFLFIPLIIAGVFFIYPTVGLIMTSFSEWRGYGDFKFVGLTNYIDVFTRPKMFGVITHNLAYLISGLMQLIGGIFLAVLINKKFWGKNFFRAVIFLPFILNSVSVVYMFGYLFLPNGMYNNFLMFLHLIPKPLKFLNKDMVNASLGFISFWQFLGFYTVIFLAGLQTIPVELYEASKIDGANAWHDILYITIPNLMPLIQVNTFLVVTGSLKAFDGPWILLRGGPGGASATLMTQIYETTFRFNNYGLGAALSIVVALIILIVSIIPSWLLREKN
jgi:raffinose/stachyose/melibiose transport system permease protein